MAYARNVTVMGYGDPKTNLLPEADRNPETFYTGIDSDLPPIMEARKNIRLINDEFLKGLRQLPEGSQDEIVAEMSLGYYGRMGHRTGDEGYTREVVEFAVTRLAGGGKAHSIHDGSRYSKDEGCIRRMRIKNKV